MIQRATIGPRTTEFCARVSPGQIARLVLIRPAPGSDHNDCFHLVRRKAHRDGGRIQFGWAIWEWPGVFLEAEHHAVYAPPGDRPWVDISPCDLPELTHRLFLPDDSALYDFDHEGIRRDNRREALTDDPLIQTFFRLAEQRIGLWNTVPGIGEVKINRATKARLDQIEFEMVQSELALSMKYTPRNARCFCGSGMKFKKCHGLDQPA